MTRKPYYPRYIDLSGSTPRRVWAARKAERLARIRNNQRRYTYARHRWERKHPITYEQRSTTLAQIRLAIGAAVAVLYPMCNALKSVMQTYEQWAAPYIQFVRALENTQAKASITQQIIHESGPDNASQ